MSGDWLDEIESQVDSTVPYYVPRLIAEIRRLRPPCCGEDHVIGDCPNDCFACLAEQRDKLLAAVKAIFAERWGCPMCDSGVLRNPAKTHWPECSFAQAEAVIAWATR